ncbi:MAG: hypothetical protein NkDv07_0535 [Candidatus Improbicoccus devescovinae]|nr:MAG: hypothetical protein NkDv07_0535 [Candidatus Improbicoccus devescovinae]
MPAKEEIKEQLKNKAFIIRVKYCWLASKWFIKFRMKNGDNCKLKSTGIYDASTGRLDLDKLKIQVTEEYVTDKKKKSKINTTFFANSLTFYIVNKSKPKLLTKETDITEYVNGDNVKGYILLLEAERAIRLKNGTCRIQALDESDKFIYLSHSIYLEKSEFNRCIPYSKKYNTFLNRALKLVNKQLRKYFNIYCDHHKVEEIFKISISEMVCKEIVISQLELCRINEKGQIDRVASGAGTQAQTLEVQPLNKGGRFLLRIHQKIHGIFYNIKTGPTYNPQHNTIYLPNRPGGTKKTTEEHKNEPDSSAHQGGTQAPPRGNQHAPEETSGASSPISQPPGGHHTGITPPLPSSSPSAVSEDPSPPPDHGTDPVRSTSQVPAPDPEPEPEPEPVPVPVAPKATHQDAAPPTVSVHVPHPAAASVTSSSHAPATAPARVSFAAPAAAPARVPFAAPPKATPPAQPAAAPAHAASAAATPASTPASAPPPVRAASPAATPASAPTPASSRVSFSDTASAPSHPAAAPSHAAPTAASASSPASAPPPVRAASPAATPASTPASAPPPVRAASAAASPASAPDPSPDPDDFAIDLSAPEPSELTVHYNGESITVTTTKKIEGIDLNAFYKKIKILEDNGGFVFMQDNNIDRYIEFYNKDSTAFARCVEFYSNSDRIAELRKVGQELRGVVKEIKRTSEAVPKS